MGSRRLAIAAASANPLAQSAGVLGYRTDWDDLPELPISPISPVPHGLDWPMEPPANRPFLQHWGFHPFVSPGASPRLQTCPVPLAVEPSSYELARRYLERNEWPPTDRDSHRGVPGGGGLQLPQANASKPRPDGGRRTVADQRRGLLPLAGRRPGPADRFGQARSPCIWYC